MLSLMGEEYDHSDHRQCRPAGEGGSAKDAITCTELVRRFCQKRDGTWRPILLDVYSGGTAGVSVVEADFIRGTLLSVEK